MIGMQGKLESEASSWGKMVSALANYLWSTKVWDGRMSGKAIHRCSCGKSEMSKSWRHECAICARYSDCAAPMDEEH